MTFYQQQLLQIKKDHYFKDYLYERIVYARLFIEKYYDTNITLNKIAEKACFSKFHFIKLFRLSYGLTPHQYLAAIRIAKAKQLLRSTSVTKTCSLVGFDSVTSFSSLFKKNTGISPSTFQKNSLFKNRNFEEVLL
jgi:AraC-like DNA-binding protein